MRLFPPGVDTRTTVVASLLFQRCAVFFSGSALLSCTCAMFPVLLLSKGSTRNTTGRRGKSWILGCTPRGMDDRSFG
ncbi:hypothetical protein BGZ57DRAFT_914191 [Hyaloscypha finlandica]|nr:hypothetical protein BGZ57DRAFT_914191 [Hyaloscypha finlandica]